MKTFWQLSYKEKLSRMLKTLPVNIIVVFLLYWFLKLPLWLVLIFVLGNIINIGYYFLKAKKEKTV